MKLSDPPPPDWRPYILVNMAMSADGKIATSNRRVSSFGSSADAENLHRLRSTVDAVMNGARTADLNPIDMGPGAAKWRRARLGRGLSEFNLRVIVSGSGSVDPAARVFWEQFSPILVVTGGRVPKARHNALKKVATSVFASGAGGEVDFGEAVRWLRKEWNVKRLLCEGGGALNDALFRADLVDELHLTICPLIIGGRKAPSISDGIGFSRLNDSAQFSLKSFYVTESERFLTYQRHFGQDTSRELIVSSDSDAKQHQKRALQNRRLRRSSAPAPEQP
jgi:riboflavin-specific deaminase-like protein